MDLGMGTELEAGAGTALGWAFHLIKLSTETSGKELVWDGGTPKFGFWVHQVSSIIETLS